MKKVLSIMLSLLLVIGLFTFAFAEDEPAETCEHVWGEWVVDSAADYRVTGHHHRTCEVCGETEDEDYEINANRLREIQFTMTNETYYRVYTGNTVQIVRKDGKALRWYSEASLRFTVELRHGYKFQTYVVYMNGEPVAPQEDGSYLIPANSGRVVVSLIPASFPDDEITDPPVGVTEVSGRICEYCGIDHGNNIVGRLFAFYHAVRAAYEQAMGRLKR
jgi:hypothetical protein